MAFTSNLTLLKYPLKLRRNSIPSLRIGQIICMTMTLVIFTLMLSYSACGANGNEKHQIQEPIRLIEWHPFENILAVAFKGLSTVWLYDTSFSPLLQIELGDGIEPLALAWSPDGETLATSAYNNAANRDVRVYLWEKDTSTLTLFLQQQEVDAPDIGWSPNGTKLAITRLNEIQIYDVATQEMLGLLEEHELPYIVESVAWSPDGTRLASGSDDNTIRIWDMALNQSVAVLPLSNAGHDVVWSPDGTELAATNGLDVSIWNTSDYQLISSLSGHTKAPFYLEWKGETLVSSGYDDIILIWHTNAWGQPTVLNNSGIGGTKRAMSLSPDGAQLAYYSEGGAPEIMNTPSSNCTATIAAGDVAGLISAIDAANANPDPDTICLAAGSTYTLTAVHNTTSGANGLPAITTDITLVGNGATIMRDPGAPAFRLVLVSSSGTLTLENLTLTGGLASGAEPGDDGGGIYNRGTLTLTDSIVTANTANADGGGIYDDGTLTLEGTTDIADNTAGDDGGGIYSAGGTVTVTDAAISGNTAGDQGGGIRSVTSSVTLTNASLTGNSAARRIATFNAWTCSRPYTVRSRSSSGEVGAVIARSTRS